MPAASLADFARSYDRDLLKSRCADAERMRERLRELFPRESLAALPLEKYAIGLGEGTLCYEYEFGSSAIGSIKGGSAFKYLVFFNKAKGVWKSTLREEPDPQKAWELLRADLVRAMDYAEQGRWSELDALPVAGYVPALRGKMAHVFFPEEVLPIFAFGHLQYFLGQLGVEFKYTRGVYASAANRRLLEELRRIPELSGWTTSEMAYLLYEWSPPPSKKADQSFEDFLETYDRTAFEMQLAEAETQRQRILALYPLNKLPDLTLEDYVGGNEVSEDNLAPLLARGSSALGGDIRGVGGNAVGIVQLKGTGLYRSTLRETGEAAEDWHKLRSALVECCELAARGEWEAIDKVSPASWIPALRTKLLHVYFPDDVLPMFLGPELGWYLDKFGIDEKPGPGKYAATPNRRLLDHLRTISALDGWSTLEMVMALRAWSPMTKREPKLLKVAPGENARHWQECLKRRMIILGWGQTGDLGSVKNVAGVREKLEATGIYDSKASLTKKTREIWDFVSAKPGDLIAANNGIDEILAVGKVTEPGYEFLEPGLDGAEDYRHALHVEWDLTLARSIPAQGDWRFVTVQEITGELKRLILDEAPTAEHSPQPSIPSMPLPPLNRILYGPPGTGKTYNVVREAARIVTGDQSLDDNAAKEEFDTALKSGRIRLATFHQSFSYEDFIEGIRPAMDEDTGSARFEVRDGIFKTMALEALGACLERLSNGDFDSRWDRLLEAIAEEGSVEIKGLKGVVWTLTETKNGNLEATNPTTGSKLTCGRAALSEVWHKLAPQNQINSSDASRALKRGAHTGVIAAVYNHLMSMDQSAIGNLPRREDPVAAARDYLAHGEHSGWRLGSARPPYVLLIDEINRGNISRIFGELITLIEDDKRHGNENALSTVLPVSQDVFSVPPNLFLLGTMNTADKSLALLDVALRRRFDFTELPPDFSLCTGLTEAMRDVLNELNERLEKRKDRDHRIGHAFFMNASSGAEFNHAFRRKVIPLLQEYFFNDIDGARYVLGEDELDDGQGFLRRIAGESRPQRNRWRWFTDVEPDMDCWARLEANLGA